jgi:GDP-D-mannose 3', 5'-epimerase
MSKATKPWALVTGAGGFIGHHLVSYLKAAGYRVRGADIKRPEYSGTDADEFMLLDLRELKNCQTCTTGMDFAEIVIGVSEKQIALVHSHQAAGSARSQQ